MNGPLLLSENGPLAGDVLSVQVRLASESPSLHVMAFTTAAAPFSATLAVVSPLVVGLLSFTFPTVMVMVCTTEATLSVHVTSTLYEAVVSASNAPFV